MPARLCKVLASRRLWSLLILALTNLATRADEPSARIEALFDRWDHPEVGGCAVGVIRDGELFYAKGFGSANVEYETPNTPTTIFEIASFSKAFTTACVALLMDEGRLRPDDTLHKWVPEMHAFDPPVRIRHLLQCRTGLWAQYHIMPLAGYDNLPIQGTYYKDDLLTILTGQRRLPFEPGAQFQYGSSDYFLLGIIVERASGKTLAEFARQRIFQPLGMTRTTYEVDPSRVVKNRAVGHYQEPDGGLRQWRNNGYVVGGGGVNTCIEDLYRWDQNFEANQLPSGKYIDEFLREGSLLGNRYTLDADAYRKQVHPDYFADEPPGHYRGLRRVQFTGGFFGSSAAMARFPQQHTTVICLSNNGDISALNQVDKMADILLDDQLRARPATPAKTYLKQSEADLSDKVGAYLSPAGILWEIKLENGQLFNRNHIDETIELKPLGRNRFEPAKYPQDTLIFEPNDAGTLQLRVEWPGGSNVHRRVTKVSPTPDELEDYVGTYHSDELATTYRFRVADHALWLRLNNRRWERLDPMIQDKFRPHLRTLHDIRIFTFRRDEDGEISRVTASMWRVKGVDFDKRSDQAN